MGTGTPDDPLRVLLVDDDEEDFVLTRHYLREIPGRGYHLEWVNDYDKALELICAHQYDVYLIDLHLGVRDGLSLLREAQSRGCGGPMILLTGQGQLETDVAAMKAGAADFLDKSGLDAVRLERAIRYACLQKKLESELEAKVRERTHDLEQEVAARRRVEERLRRADQRKDEFLASLAHELRNPLMPITNAVGILQMAGPQPPSAQKAMDILDRQVRVMVRLIDDLLDMARITNGKLRLECEPVRLKEVVDSAMEVSQVPLEKAGVKCTVKVPPDLPEISGDRVRLAQVFTNLLNNAAKYTPSGGSVTVSVERGEDGWLVARVRDTGVGVAPELLPGLFDLFAQEERSLERSRDGLGIGLTLVRGLVELHGGKVAVHSEGVGCGTEFTVRLPVPAA
jgi:signal transduction histidine kinase